MKRRAFTLVELLVVIAMVAVLAMLIAGVSGKAIRSFETARCMHSLRQLGVATQLYTQDHNQTFFPYSEALADGKLWYFGFEPWSSIASAEGERTLDPLRGPLYPYIQSTGGVEVCPSFPYKSALWKPKFKGASYGYGYNTLLSWKKTVEVRKPSQVILFGDCAQVNNFQAPASSSNPMIEEFYMFETNYRTAHFRHGSQALFVFLDGHVAGLSMQPGTQDLRITEETIGRISPLGSTAQLW